MNQDLFLSTTFQGALVSLIGAVLVIFKVQISNEELTAVISSACVIVGTLMVIIGRIKAVKPIGSIAGIKIK